MFGIEELFDNVRKVPGNLGRKRYPEKDNREVIALSSHPGNVLGILQIDSRELLTVGSELKWRISGVIKRESTDANEKSTASEEKIHLIEKRPGVGNRAEDYFKKWLFLYQHGFPVISDVWITNRGTVVMPDLTVDGSRFFGKARLEKLHNPAESDPTLDSIFLGVDVNKIQAKAIRCCPTSNKCEYQTPPR